MEKVKVEHHSTLGGAWFAGWLFTIGFLKLSLVKAIIGLALWPYYLGVAFAM